METTAPDVLSAAGEDEWKRLRRTFEFSDSFWVGFVFSAAAAEADVLRRRVEAFLGQDGRRLLLIRSATTESLKTAAPSLMNRSELRGAVWFDALHALSGEWEAALETFLVRLNEHRDALIRGGPAPLILVLPYSSKARVRDVAPDLWSIRSIVLHIGTQALHAETLRPVMASERSAERIDAEFALEEAQRRGDAGAGTAIPALLRAAEGFLADGDVDRAEEAAHRALGASSVFNDKGGEANALALLSYISDRRGDIGGAIESMERAIEIVRALGEVPPAWLEEVSSWRAILGDYAAAEASLTEAIEVRVLAERNAESQRALAFSYVRFAWLLRMQGEIDRAVVQLRRAREVAHNDERASVAIELESMRLAYQSGDMRGAHLAAETALQIARREVLRNPGNDLVSRNMVSALIGKAHAQVAVNAIDDAIGTLGEAVMIAGQASETQPSDETFFALARALLMLSDTLGRRGNIDEALRSAIAARDAALRAAQLLTDRPTLELLAVAGTRIGDLSLVLGDDGSARSAFLQVLDTLARHVEIANDKSETASMAAYAAAGLAFALARNEQADELRDAFRLAMASIEAAADLGLAVNGPMERMAATIGICLERDSSAIDSDFTSNAIRRLAELATRTSKGDTKAAVAKMLQLASKAATERSSEDAARGYFAAATRLAADARSNESGS